MTKQEAIDHIKALYPPDSSYPDTAKIGREIIEQAKRICSSWEKLPEDVLMTAASMMISKERE